MKYLKYINEDFENEVIGSDIPNYESDQEEDSEEESESENESEVIGHVNGSVEKTQVG